MEVYHRNIWREFFVYFLYLCFILLIIPLIVIFLAIFLLDPIPNISTKGLLSIFTVSSGFVVAGSASVLVFILFNPGSFLNIFHETKLIIIFDTMAHKVLLYRSNGELVESLSFSEIYWEKTKMIHRLWPSNHGDNSNKFFRLFRRPLVYGFYSYCNCLLLCHNKSRRLFGLFHKDHARTIPLGFTANNRLKWLIIFEKYGINGHS